MTTGAATGMDVRVREMDLGDVDAVHAIERATAATPWSRKMILGEVLSLGSIVLVAEAPAEGVVGFLLASDQAGSWHLLNVVVGAEWRRRGVGEALVREFLDRADDHPHRGVTLEVRVSNDVAIRLYERLGFAGRGVRQRYYSDNGEDALIMWRGGTEDGA